VRGRGFVPSSASEEAQLAWAMAESKAADPRGPKAYDVKEFDTPGMMQPLCGPGEKHDTTTSTLRITCGRCQ